VACRISRCHGSILGCGRQLHEDQAGRDEHGGNDAPGRQRLAEDNDTDNEGASGLETVSSWIGLTIRASAAKARTSLPRLADSAARLRRLQALGRPSSRGPWRRERTDCDVVSVRIPKGELRCLSVRVHVRLLLEPGTSARALLSAISKSSTRRNKRSPLPGGALSGLIKRDARVHPTGGGRAGRFHPYPGSDRSGHGPEASRAGRRATGTI
jgi:hypothetical protein